MRRERQGVLLRRDHALAAGRRSPARAARGRRAAASPARREPGALRRRARALPRGGRRAAGARAQRRARPRPDAGRRRPGGRHRGRVVAHRLPGGAHVAGRSARRRRLGVALVARARTARPRSSACSPPRPRSPRELGWLDGHAAAPERMPKRSFPPRRRVPSLGACPERRQQAGGRALRRRGGGGRRAGGPRLLRRGRDLVAAAATCPISGHLERAATRSWATSSPRRWPTTSRARVASR